MDEGTREADQQIAPGEHQQRAITTPTGSAPGYRARYVRTLPQQGQPMDVVWSDADQALCVWNGQAWVCNTSGGGSSCYDYVVDSQGGGSHLTLWGNSGALRAALLAGSRRTIAVCHTNEILTTPMDLSDISIGSNTSSILIEAIGDHNTPRQTLPTVGSHMLSGISQNTGLSVVNGHITFKGFSIVVASSFALLALNADLVDLHLLFSFVDCDFSLNGASLYSNVNGRVQMYIEFVRCTGLINLLYQYQNGGVQPYFGDLTIRDSALAVNFLSQQFAVPATGYAGFTLNVYDSILTLQQPNSYYWGIGARRTLNFRGASLVYTGPQGTTCLTILQAQEGMIVDAGDLQFFSSNQNVGLFNFNSSGGFSVQNAIILLGNIRAITDPGVSQTTPLVTLSSNLSGARSGSILAPQWTTPYSGPASGAPGSGGTGSTGSGAAVGDSFITVSHDADLTAERVLQATAPVAMADSGANGNVTLSHRNVQELPDAHHFQSHAPADHTKEIARSYLPFGSCGINGYAVVL